MLYITQVIFGRALTETEATTLSNYSGSNSANYIDINRRTVLNPDGTGSYPDDFIKAWNSQASADGYLAIVNSFSPAPSLVKTLS